MRGAHSPPSPASPSAGPGWAAMHPKWGEGQGSQPNHPTASLTPLGLFCLSVCLSLPPGKVPGEQAPHGPDAVLLTASADGPRRRVSRDRHQGRGVSGRAGPRRQRAGASASGKPRAGERLSPQPASTLPGLRRFVWTPCFAQVLCFPVGCGGALFAVHRRSARQGLAVW